MSEKLETRLTLLGAMATTLARVGRDLGSEVLPMRIRWRLAVPAATGLALLCAAWLLSVGWNSSRPLDSSVYYAGKPVRSPSVERPEGHSERLPSDAREIVATSESKVATSPKMTTNGTSKEREVYRKLRDLASVAGSDFPVDVELKSDQWKAVLDLGDSIIPASDADMMQRSNIASTVGEQRYKAGLMELINPKASSPDSLTEEERRRVKELQLPNAPGQIVGFCYEGGAQYAIRINPGDSPEIDAISSEIAAYGSLASAGLRQILEGH